MAQCLNSVKNDGSDLLKSLNSVQLLSYDRPDRPFNICRVFNVFFPTCALGHIGVFLTEFSRKAIIGQYCYSSLAAVNQDNHLNFIPGNL